MIAQLTECAKAEKLNIFLWTGFSFGLFVTNLNVALYLFVVACEFEVEL